MLDIVKDIHSLTFFRRNSAGLLKQLKKTKRPVVLTVNGKAEAVLLDAEAYQTQLDRLAQQDVIEGIRQGFDDVRQGRMRPAREALEEFRRKHAIPR